MSLFSFFARASRNAPSAAPTPLAASTTQSAPLDSSPAACPSPGQCQDSEFSWQQSIPSRTDAGKTVIDEVLRQLQGLCWSEPDLFGVRLALEEAVINAIKHGNRGDESKQVTFVCHVSPERLHIE